MTSSQRSTGLPWQRQRLRDSYLQLVETGRQGVVKLKNMAVREAQQGWGIGYPPGIRIDGMELRDRVWLNRTVP